MHMRTRTATESYLVIQFEPPVNYIGSSEEEVHQREGGRRYMTCRRRGKRQRVERGKGGGIRKPSV